MSDELDELRMLGEGCVNEPRDEYLEVAARVTGVSADDMRDALAQAKQEGPKLHTHTFSDPIADKLRTQTNELTRAYAIIGVLTRRIQKLQPEGARQTLPVVITEEELVAISSHELKLEVDTASHMINLKVEN
jgi:hypothetical protein